MSNELARTEPQQLSMTEQIEYAKLITQGDLVPKAYQGKPANAMLAIGLGQAMGLSPAESLYRIDVIQNKPTASAELIASNVRRAGHVLRVEVDEQNTSATATIYRADDPDYPHTVTRDLAWAKRMGLDSKDNYKRQPTTMLQWRAITAAAREACSEALYGVGYTADEIKDLGERPAPAPSAVDRLKPQPEPDPEPPMVLDRDWKQEADSLDGDPTKLEPLWREAGASGADQETLDYIYNSAKTEQ